MLIYSIVYPTTSCSCFKVSGLILWCLIHFELTLVQGERQGSSFNLLHVDIQFSQQHLLKDAVFSPSCILGPFVEDQLAVAVRFMSGSSIVHWSSCFCVNTMLFLLLWLYSVV
jgi:hypothetical protein